MHHFFNFAATVSFCVAFVEIARMGGEQHLYRHCLLAFIAIGVFGIATWLSRKLKNERR